MKFAKKSVLITGGGRGLGRRLAEDFGREGALVTVNYAASGAAAEETVEGIIGAGGEAMACHADVCRASDVNAMVEKVVARYGGIDILVNSAGISLDSPFLEMSEDDWDKVFNVNLKGPFLVSQAVGHRMKAAGHGCIVNISATTAVQARVGNANYCASKAGLNMLTQSMALELGPQVNVNCVALGFVDSPLVRELFTEDELRQGQDAVPLKRMTTYKETSAFVMMLASQTASFMTGQTIPFDGGRVMR